MSDLLPAALYYAELGYRVFPCAPGGKAPITEHGFHDATTDPVQIEAWWAATPSANIGLATAGLLVVDVDGADNPWLAEHPDWAHDLTSSPLQFTPHGGRHFAFRAGEHAYRCTEGVLAPRVDTRGDGGYILVAPSVVDGAAYRWAPEMELDVPPDRLPLPPDWLTQGLVPSSPTAPRVAAGGDDANPIPAGQRNGTLARLAGTMRRVGMSRSEILAAITQINADRCQPPLSHREVERIAGSVVRYEPDQVAVAVAENHYGQDFGSTQPQQLEFAAITSQELDAGNYELEYLINGILVHKQPGVIAGPKKSLKTNISIDLALSLASGGKFLNYFQAERAVRVGVMSGESGAATIQETARRIAASKQAKLADFTNAFWSFEVPQLGDVLHAAALERFIERHQLEVLILDPTYLMMMGIGSDAGNLFIVGSFLKSLADVTQRTGCTPILCHHLKKGIADPYEPAELENIAWAGFQEFVRQWLLLNRRVPYDPVDGGNHGLWASVGGSAGHSGLWGVDIEEGTRQDLAGRRWDVRVLSAAEAYAARDQAAALQSESTKQRTNDAKRTLQKQSILDALAAHPNGETPRVIRESAGIGARSIQLLLTDLLDDGAIESCHVQKHTRTEAGYRLVGGGPANGTAGP